MRVDSFIEIFKRYEINFKLVGSYVVGLVEKRQFFLEGIHFKGDLTYLLDGDIGDIECVFRASSPEIVKNMHESNLKKIELKNIDSLMCRDKLDFLVDECSYFNLYLSGNYIEFHFVVSLFNNELIPSIERILSFMGRVSD